MTLIRRSAVYRLRALRYDLDLQVSSVPAESHPRQAVPGAGRGTETGKQDSRPSGPGTVSVDVCVCVRVRVDVCVCVTLHQCVLHLCEGAYLLRLSLP